MLLGDKLIWNGRVFTVLGFEPMGIPGARAELEDLRTGEHVWVPVAELEGLASTIFPSGPSGAVDEPA